MCNILLLICRRREQYISATNKHQISLSMFMLVLYHSGKKSASLWFMCTDNEMSVMINYAALRFCCGAYLCSLNYEANKCLCLAIEQELNFLLAKWYIVCIGWSILKINFKFIFLFFKGIGFLTATLKFLCVPPIC